MSQYKIFSVYMRLILMSVTNEIRLRQKTASVKITLTICLEQTATKSEAKSTSSNSRISKGYILELMCMGLKFLLKLKNTDYSLEYCSSNYNDRGYINT